MTAMADEVYAEVAPLAGQDAANGYATRALVRAIGTMFGQVEEAVRAREGKAAWTQVWDVNRCPTFLLPFLGQCVGVKVDPGTDAAMRAQIKEEAPWKRGWLSQLIALIQGTLAVRVNLVATPNFEYAAVGTGAWQPYVAFPTGNPTIARSTAQHFAGAASMQIVTPGTTVKEGASIALFGNFRAGVTYIASVYIKGTLGTETVRLRLGNPTDTDFAETGDRAIESAAWKRIEGTAWTPLTDMSVARFTISRASAVGQTIYIDNAQVEQGAVAGSYLDGDQVTAARWEATPGQSVSVGLGEPRVTVIERDTTPWHFLVNTSPSQTPLPALTEAVVKHAKPVGTLVSFATTDLPLIAEGTKLISEGVATIAAAKLADIT